VVVFREALVTESDAHELLEEYFESRRGSTAGYQTTFPDPAQFVSPAGVFLVVENETASTGCGGIRRLSDSRYEVKHLWVRPKARGLGLGRRLLVELERRAADLGATEIVLDTNETQAEASSLYRSAGYESIEPYNENPNANLWLRKTLNRS